MIRLSDDFFCRETTLVARELLGKVMLYHSPQGLVSGIVVEDEAYLGVVDPGSHSFRGQTKRNSVMFGPGGMSYIYRIYGIHCCYNVTTDQADQPAAVLIRALQPLAGIDLMKTNRGKEKLTDLCSGPGKLVQAMAIPQALNGSSVVSGPIGFYEPATINDLAVIQTTRVGLSQGKDLFLRFYLQNCRYISRK